jgi:hypothetical protein
VSSGSGKVILAAVRRRREVTVKVPRRLILGPMSVAHPSGARREVKDGRGGIVWHGGKRAAIWLFTASGKKQTGCSDGPFIVWCNDEQQDLIGNQFRDVLMEGDEAITGIDGRLPKPKL